MKQILDSDHPTRDTDHQNHAEKDTMAKKIKNFIFNQKDSIGKGYSSVVYKGVNEISKQLIAVKVIQLSKIKNQVQRYLLNNEMKALRKLDHPNILKCFDILMTKNNVYIITQYCKNGDFSEFLKQNGRFPEIQALKYTKDILQGYLHIQENRIVHRDLKTANIFLNNGIAKIADFGFCEFIDESKPSIPYNVGSPAYMSPQSYLQNSYSNKSDIWSIGIILYELLVGQGPFKKIEYKQLIKNLTNGILGIPNNIQISQTTKSILQMCFKQQINDRIDCKKFLQVVVNELNLRNLQSIQKGQTNLNPQNGSEYIDRNSTKIQFPQSHSIIFNYHKRDLSPEKVSNNSLYSSQLKQKNFYHHKINIPNPMTKTQQVQIMKNVIEYIMFLYRLSKMIGEGINMPFSQPIINVLHIIKKNKNYISKEIDQINFTEVELKKQYEYMKTRFQQLKVLKLQSYDLSLKIHDQKYFRNQTTLSIYINQIKNDINQISKYINFQAKINQVAGVILDYLMLYHQFLILHNKNLNILDITKQACLGQILKQKPKPLKQSHIKLLLIKKSMINV